MKRLLTTLAAAAVFGMLAGAAEAAPITVSSSQSQTSAGQNFIFTFNGLAASDGSGGTLVLHARGDYGTAVNETLSWDAEGQIAAGPVGAFSSGGTGGTGGPFDSVTAHTDQDYEFQRTYALSNAVLTALLADSLITFTVDLSSAVGIVPSGFVEITINYTTPNGAVDVPLPSALPLVGTGLGLLGLFGWRRRRRILA